LGGEAWAAQLAAKLIDAGFSGHIDSESGHGLRPEGLMRFAAFFEGAVMTAIGVGLGKSCDDWADSSLARGRAISPWERLLPLLVQLVNQSLPALKIGSQTQPREFVLGKDTKTSQRCSLHQCRKLRGNSHHDQIAPYPSCGSGNNLPLYDFFHRPHSAVCSAPLFDDPLVDTNFLNSDPRFWPDEAANAAGEDHCASRVADGQL
jgi:hypothetical protein